MAKNTKRNLRTVETFRGKPVKTFDPFSTAEAEYDDEAYDEFVLDNYRFSVSNDRLWNNREMMRQSLDEGWPIESSFDD